MGGKKYFDYLSLLCGLLLMSTSGTIYLFSTYSSSLSSQLSYTAPQLSFIATFGQSFHYLSAIPTGILADRYGGRITSLIGGLLQGIGYTLMALTYSGELALSNYVLFTFYYSLVGMGSASSYSGALTTNVKIFPEKFRGLIVGSHAALFGLSGLIFSQINSQLFVREGQDLTFEFFICLALVMVVANFLGFMFLGSPIIPTTRTQGSPFLANEVDESEDLGEDGSRSTSATFNEKNQSMSNDQSEFDPLLTKGPLIPVLDVSGIQLFKQLDFWALFVGLGLGASCGLMYINNVGQVVEAMAYADPPQYSDEEVQKITNLHVSLISAFNCSSRIVFGALSDYLLRKCNVPRPLLLCVSTVVALAGHLTMAFGISFDVLILCTILIGGSYGTLFAIVPTLVGDYFGIPSFGTNWGWVAVSPAFTGPITNLLFGSVYDRHSVGSQETTVCDGTPCFQVSFFVTSGIEVVVFFLFLFLVMRRRNGIISGMVFAE